LRRDQGTVGRNPHSRSQRLEPRHSTDVEASRGEGRPIRDSSSGGPFGYDSGERNTSFRHEELTNNQETKTMRFMIIVKATKDSEAGVMPSEQLLTEMGKFNEELVKAGIMLAGEGLQPSSKGARVRFSGTTRTVIDGPFTETKELIAGFWLW